MYQTQVVSDNCCQNAVLCKNCSYCLSHFSLVAGIVNSWLILHCCHNYHSLALVLITLLVGENLSHVWALSEGSWRLWLHHCDRCWAPTRMQRLCSETHLGGWVVVILWVTMLTLTQQYVAPLEWACSLCKITTQTCLRTGASCESWWVQS